MACADYAGRTKDNLGASQVPLGGSQILRLELKCMPICERIFSCPLFIASRRSRIDSVEFEGALENHGHRAGIGPGLSLMVVMSAAALRCCTNTPEILNTFLKSPINCRHALDNLVQQSCRARQVPTEIAYDFRRHIRGGAEACFKAYSAAKRFFDLQRIIPMEACSSGRRKVSSKTDK